MKNIEETGNKIHSLLEYMSDVLGEEEFTFPKLFQAIKEGKVNFTAASLRETLQQLYKGIGVLITRDMRLTSGVWDLQSFINKYKKVLTKYKSAKDVGHALKELYNSIQLKYVYADELKIMKDTIIEIGDYAQRLQNDNNFLTKWSDHEAFIDYLDGKISDIKEKLATKNNMSNSNNITWNSIYQYYNALISNFGEMKAKFTGAKSDRQKAGALEMILNNYSDALNFLNEFTNVESQKLGREKVRELLFSDDVNNQLK